MFSRLKEKLRSLIDRKRRTKPLVTRRHDFVVLGRIHGRRLPRLSQIKHLRQVLSPKEKRVFQWSILLLLVGIVWYGAVFAGAHRSEVAAVGGRYTEAVVGTPQRINPLFASLNDVDRDLSQLIYTGLMRYNEDQQLEPDLAERYELSEDKKTYTFYLRQGITWHTEDRDNPPQPLTARDVAFTFELIQNEETGSPLMLTFQGVDIQVIDDYTVAFTLQEPFAPFLSSLTVGILPAYAWEHIPPAQVRLAQLNLQPVGTGPFRFSKLVKNQSGAVSRIELERSERFYRKPAYIEEFVFEFFSDYDSEFGAIAALREGRVDGIHFVPAGLKEKVERKHIVVHTLQLPQYSALFFNQTGQPLFEEAEVRQALALALDKQRILRESLRGEGQVIEGPILPGFPGYTESVTATPYAVDEANTLLDKHFERVSASAYLDERRVALLAEFQGETTTSTEAATTTTAEVTTTPDADLLAQVEQQLNAELSAAQTFYRKRKDGSIVEIELVTAATPEYHTAAALIAGFWQELGIKTTVREVDPQAIQRDVLKGRKYDVLLYGLIIGSDPDQYPFWHSTQIAHPGLNLAQYVNRDVDALLQKIRETDDDAEVHALHRQLQEKLLADRPAIFLYTPVYRYVMNDMVQGFGQQRIFHPTDRLAGVTNWYVNTKGSWNF